MANTEKISNSVKVSVSSVYDWKNSNPSEGHYVFRYDITIENLRSHGIKILRRYWKVYDPSQGYSGVSGDGVLGVNPELHPGEIFNYFSNVGISSGVGYMKGRYIAMDLTTKKEFEIEIPKFDLLADGICN